MNKTLRFVRILYLVLFRYSAAADFVEQFSTLEAPGGYKISPRYIGSAYCKCNTIEFSYAIEIIEFI